MKTFRCTFSAQDRDWITCVANSPSSAAKIYADDRVSSYDTVQEFLESNKNKVYVKVFNESDCFFEGWFEVEYEAVIICYAEKCETPDWAKKDG